MTQNEYAAKLASIEAEVEENVKQYNEFFQASQLKEASEKDATIKKLIEDYGKWAEGMVFDKCKEEADPMLAAVKTLRYEVLAVKDGLVKGTNIPTRTVNRKSKAIDLLKLHKECGHIGADEKWPYMAQKLNFLFTAQRCQELGISPKAVNDSYAMDQIAKDIDMGKTPTSNTQTLNALQRVVSAMVGEQYKAISKDVNYLRTVFAKKANKEALTVQCATHKNFVSYLAEVCYRIVTDSPYNVVYKTK